VHFCHMAISGGLINEYINTIFDRPWSRRITPSITAAWGSCCATSPNLLTSCWTTLSCKYRPGYPNQTLHRFPASLSITVPMSLMYGYTPESFNDPAIEAAEASVHLGAPLLMAGSTLANIFPVLTKVPSWFPGAGFKRKAEKVRYLTQETQRIPWEFVQREFVSRFQVPGQ